MPFWQALKHFLFISWTLFFIMSKNKFRFRWQMIICFIFKIVFLFSLQANVEPVDVKEEYQFNALHNPLITNITCHGVKRNLNNPSNVIP